MSGAFQAVSMFVDISGFTQTSEALIRSGQEEGEEILSKMLSGAEEKSEILTANAKVRSIAKKNAAE